MPVGPGHSAPGELMGAEGYTADASLLQETELGYLHDLHDVKTSPFRAKGDSQHAFQLLRAMQHARKYERVLNLHTVQEETSTLHSYFWHSY